MKRLWDILPSVPPGFAAFPGDAGFALRRTRAIDASPVRAAPREL